MPCPTAGADGRGRIGEVLGDRYELVRLLGAGGMGVVYEARHRVIGRRFAVKLLYPHCAQRPSILTRFQREARAAGSLENEHIAAALDFGLASDGAPYLVMEYLAGQDLAALLAREGSLPAGRAVSLIIQGCRGLAAAHANDIVHRDLKPANLFLTHRSDGADLVKVLDFGIAKLLDSDDDTSASLTASGKLLGTVSYMSPEQARGDADLDRRIDVYALGAILYELLTAARAHPGGNHQAVLFHILTQSCERLRTLRPDLPRGLDAVVEKAMARDRAGRYASVDELAAALAPFAAPETDTSRERRERAARATAETVEEAHTVRWPQTGASGGAGSRARVGRPLVLIVAAGALLAAGGILLGRGRRDATATPRASETVVRVAAPPSPPPPLPAPAAPTPASVEPPRATPASSPVKRKRSPRRRDAVRPGDDGFDARNPYNE